MFLPTMQCWLSYITYLKITQSHMAPGHQIKFSVRTLWTKLINLSLFSENWVQCIQEMEFISQGKEADGLFSFPFLSSLSLPPSFFPSVSSLSRWISLFLFSSSLPFPPLPPLLGTNEKGRKEWKTWYCAQAHIESMAFKLTGDPCQRESAALWVCEHSIQGCWY